ncbi:hypothetical protein [Novipirellula aureliae]|uniref:hypothetical protein n=1 Tax=Novipirellula aureliae TaxID=2527966 RepID=UPI0011B5E91E|nr:hypothetical protein [Novipirellula aureliae]
MSPGDDILTAMRSLGKTQSVIRKAANATMSFGSVGWRRLPVVSGPIFAPQATPLSARRAERQSRLRKT